MAKSKAKAAPAAKDDWEEVPVAAEKDDWEEIPAEKPKNPSELRAMARGAGAGAAQATTFGYMPNITAYIANKLGGKYKDLKTGEMREVVDYKTARDRGYQDLAEAEKEAPKSFMAGNLIANLANPLTRINPEAGLAKTMLANAAQGFAYNPGDNPGTDNGLQLEERLYQGGGAGLASGGMKFAADKLIPLARALKMKSTLEKPGAERYLKNEVDDAIAKLRSEYIDPRDAKVTAALKKKTVSFNPDNLEGIGGVNSAGKETKGLELYGDALKKRVNPETGRVDLRGDKAERLRQVLDRKSGISSKNAIGNPKVAAKGAQEGAAAKILREQRRSVAPELEPTFKEMSYANGLASELADKSKTPEALVKGQYFGDMGNKIIDLDSMAGTNLRDLGADVQRARRLQVGEMNAPFLVREPVRLGQNAAAQVGRLTAPLMGKGLGDAEIKLLLEEAMRGKYSPQEYPLEEEE